MRHDDLDPAKCLAMALIALGVLVLAFAWAP